MLPLLALSIGFLLRAAVAVYIGPDTTFPDSDYYIDNARSVLAGEGYDPSFFRGPLYSYFIAAILALSGSSVLAVLIAQALLWTIIALLCASISFQIFGNKAVAGLAAAIVSLHPFLIALSIFVVAETLFVLCYTLALWLVYRARSSQSTAPLFFSGLCLGFSFLTRSTAIAFVPLLVIWLVVLDHHRIKRVLARSLVLIAGFSLLAVPYVITLHRNLGAWTLDGYGTRFLWTSTVMPLYGPVDNVIEKAEDLTEEQRQGVLRYTPEVPPTATFAERNRLYVAMALRYVKENPIEYAQKLLGKFLNNFALTVRTNTGPSVEQWRIADIGAALVLGPTYLLFFAGLWMCRRRLVDVGPLLIVIVVSMGVFTLYLSRVRYTLSIVPAMVPMIAFSAEQIIHWSRSSSSRDLK